MKIELRALAQLLCQVFEIEDITQAATPGGRWALLQAWLQKHPRWKIKVARWVKLPSAQAYEELREWVSEEGAVPLALLKAFIAPEIEARIRAAIETLQTLYKDRAQEMKRPPKLKEQA